jgi:site-specific DNA recombinase
VKGKGAPTKYKCRKNNCVQRDLILLDKWVQTHLLKRLKRPDAAELLAGRQEDPVNVRGAQEELRAARKDLDDLAAEFGAGAIDMQEWRVARASARARKEKAEAVLATAVQVNPAVGLLGAEDVEAAWGALDLSRQRAVIDWAMTVRVLPAKSGRRPGGTYWDRDAVEIVWK